VPGMQEYLPQDHLTPGSPTASQARPHGPNRLVMEGRGVVTRAQAPDQGGCQDGGMAESYSGVAMSMAS
jgi:hypothetical protein